jgi:hypothetical protein
MRMIAGAILFLGAVGLVALTPFRSSFSFPNPDTLAADGGPPPKPLPKAKERSE